MAVMKKLRWAQLPVSITLQTSIKWYIWTFPGILGRTVLGGICGEPRAVGKLRGRNCSCFPWSRQHNTSNGRHFCLLPFLLYWAGRSKNLFLFRKVEVKHEKNIFNRLPSTPWQQTRSLAPSCCWSSSLPSQTSTTWTSAAAWCPSPSALDSQ